MGNFEVDSSGRRGGTGGRKKKSLIAVGFKSSEPFHFHWLMVSVLIDRFEFAILKMLLSASASTCSYNL